MRLRLKQLHIAIDLNVKMHRSEISIESVKAKSGSNTSIQWVAFEGLSLLFSVGPFTIREYRLRTPIPLYYDCNLPHKNLRKVFTMNISSSDLGMFSKNAWRLCNDMLASYGIYWALGITIIFVFLRSATPKYFKPYV